MLSWVCVFLDRWAFLSPAQRASVLLTGALTPLPALAFFGLSQTAPTVLIALASVFYGASRARREFAVLTDRARQDQEPAVWEVHVARRRASRARRVLVRALPPASRPSVRPRF